MLETLYSEREPAEIENMSKAPLWSATPTPFLSDLTLDRESIPRMVEHHLAMDVDGLMLGGSCGEGPWMPLDDLVELTRETQKAARGRLQIAVQITDNSVRRMLKAIEKVASAGAEIAVVASPYFLMHSSPEDIFHLYTELIRKSPLPIGFYDRGKNAAYVVETERLQTLFAEPNLRMIKDSSTDPARRDAALAAKKSRPELQLLNGDEFNCVDYVAAGYDGLLLGGGIFNGRIARQILNSVGDNNLEEAKRTQDLMNDLMLRVYGGPKIECWLSGLKYLLVQLGVFTGINNYLNYTLTDSCKAAIDEILQGADASSYRKYLVP